MLKIVEAEAAIQDVIGAADYIAQYASLNTSDKFLQAVKDTYRQIADMPGIGSPRDYGQAELQGMRFWHVTKFPQYLVFYITTMSELRILRVLHGARDITTVFSPPEE